MIALYLFLAGAYLYYCKSKYFPAGIFKLDLPYSSWLAAGLFLAGTVLYVLAEGWTSGLLLAVCALSLTPVLLQFTAILGKPYFYGLALLAHCLALLDLVA